MRWLLAVGVCAVLALGGCGGSDSSTSDSAPAPGRAQATTATSASQPSQQSTAGQDEGKATQTEGSAGQGKEKSKGSSPQRTATVKLVKVPPISSAPVTGSKSPAPGVKTVKDGDNSVQTYGVESDSSSRTEAAIALQAYLNDRLKEDWGSACAALAQRPKAQLEKLARSASEQGKELSGCAGAMEALGEGAPLSQRQEEARITEVLSLRGEGDVPGDPSYLIFIGPPGSTLYSMPMYLEAGGWKVGLALAAELPV